MDLRFSTADEDFRATIRGWLEEHLGGEREALRGRGGPGDEHSLVEQRRAWEQLMARDRWTCLGWPVEYGGRGATLHQEVIFYEEYARAQAPGRLGHIGETLLGPTLIAFGTEAQRRRFLPAIQRVEALWCQGYSEPNAGSDLANVGTRARLEGDAWIIEGQKTWTSGAHLADWCFVLCRTDPEAQRHRGLSYLLVPMDQPGVEVRPIKQLTGTGEFSEVFFDGARAAAEDVVGEVNGGWTVAMGTLAFERGASTLGQQLSFQTELDAVIAAAKANGAAADQGIRRRIADLWARLRVMRLNALRTLSDGDGARLSRPAMINKLYWATWHRDLGELAMDVLGPDGELVPGWPYELSAAQRLFLFSRADTIYAGSNQIQRNIIGERALGLPRGPR